MRICDSCREPNEPTELGLYKDPYNEGGIPGPGAGQTPVVVVDLCETCLKALTELDWRELQRRKPRPSRAKAKAPAARKARAPRKAKSPAPGLGRGLGDVLNGSPAAPDGPATVDAGPVQLAPSEMIPFGAEHAEAIAPDDEPF